MLLEFSQYLENYLWPNYSTDATDAHVLSIVVMVNEKFRERVPAWEVCCFTSVYVIVTEFSAVDLCIIPPGSLDLALKQQCVYCIACIAKA